MTPQRRRRASAANVRQGPGSPVDPIIVLSVLMLAVWAVGTWFDGPGWIHFLLTAGVFLLVWRIAAKAQAQKGSPKA